MHYINIRLIRWIQFFNSGRRNRKMLSYHRPGFYLLDLRDPDDEGCESAKKCRFSDRVADHGCGEEPDPIPSLEKISDPIGKKNLGMASGPMNVEHVQNN